MTKKIKHPSYPFLITLAVIGIFTGTLLTSKKIPWPPTLTLAKAAQHNDILIKARGTSGEEKIALYINSDPVEYWNLSTTYENYIYTPKQATSVETVSVHFINNRWEPEEGINDNVEVDYIKVSGTVYESEDSTTYSTGTWDQNTWCAPGNKKSQWLNCTGALTFEMPEGTVVGGTNSVETTVTFHSNSKIVVDTDISAIGNLLAQEIGSSLGWSFEVVSEIPADGQYIHLHLGCDEIPRDGFMYASENDREITLCASGESGLKFAVYDFAERHLGVRWLFPAPDDLGTYRPSRDNLTVSFNNSVHIPAYVNRRFSQGYVSKEYGTWADRLRMTTSESVFHHNLYNVFPPAQYRLSRPDFYPVHTDGIRYPKPEYVGVCKTDPSLCTEENHRWQPVLTAPGITDEAVKNIRTYLTENPNTQWYSLGMNDSLTWGQQQQQGQPLNSLGYIHMSDYFFPWVNEVVSKVLETHPQSQFGLLAYHNLIDPPTQKLNDQVVPYITYDRMQWADPVRRQADISRTQQWAGKVNELGWYDYVYGDQIRGDAPFYDTPRVYPHLMAQYLRFGRDQGVRHYYAEAYPSTEYWSEGPKLYVLSKLLWNPDLDVDALLVDWYQAAVGNEAATYLENYYAHWESFWTQRVPQTLWFQNRKADYLNFNTNTYLTILTVEDQTYLQAQMNGLRNATRGTEFEKRADFFLRAWDQVNAQSFSSPRFMLSNGIVPDGYTPFFEDAIEGTAGTLPVGWSFWNRPNVGSTAQASLSSEYASKGTSSLAIQLQASSEEATYAVAYLTNPTSTHTKYCMKAKVFAPSSSHTITLTFRRADGSQAHKKEFTYPEKTGWQNSVVCTEIPTSHDFTEVRAWVGIKDNNPGTSEIWFDDVILYTKP